MKPIKVKGCFDFMQEIRVEKMKDSDKGFDIIMPLYTHLNEKGEKCGILVNRGWIPCDIIDERH